MQAIRHQHPVRRAAVRVVLPCLCGLVLILSGCARRFPAERIPKTKWFVMPLEQPPAMSEMPREVRGWWFGARTIRQNPRAGAMMAESFTRELSKLDCINLYSPIEIQGYFADKRSLLTKSYPYLTRQELDALLAQVPSIEYARELGADKILSGRILRHYMGENRTIHWWWSTVDVQCEVIDVMTGNVEWSNNYVARQQFSSQSAVQQEIAAQLAKDLKKEYFWPMAEE